MKGVQKIKIVQLYEYIPKQCVNHIQTNPKILQIEKSELMGS